MVIVTKVDVMYFLIRHQTVLLCNGSMCVCVCVIVCIVLSVR